MRSVILGRSTSRIALLSFALLAIASCGRKKEQPTTETSSGAIAPAPGALQVTDVTFGRNVGADRRVTNPADSFSARDTIYASVHTIGAAPNAILVTRWIYQDGQVVNENNENISPSGDAYTEFHVFKPSGWPAGRYTVKVLMNGQEVQSKDFNVK